MTHEVRPAAAVSMRWAAYTVHLLTASGAVVALLTARAVMAGDYREAFLWMTIAVMVDVVDGPLARSIRIKTVCPEIDGRRLDDIVDYLNYTFLPILLLVRARWLPEPVWLWAASALVASLFGFAHRGAKQESAGFFRGFPSYWNIVAFYVAVGIRHYGTSAVGLLVLVLSVLTVVPVRMVYPNQPPRWRMLYLGGGVLWLVTLLVLLWKYPHITTGWLCGSLVYPVFYLVSSVYLDIMDRRGRLHSATDPPVLPVIGKEEE